MKYLHLSLKIFSFLFISFIIINIGFYLYAYITPKMELKSANQITLFDNKDNIVFENIDGTRWINYDNISQNLIDATVSVEDKNFFKHQGFDYPRIIKALFNNVKSGNITGGASTISQQYVKNLFLSFDKTWSRKIEEAFLTFELEVHYDKEEILEGYLNTINYGAGNYGIENASKYYFNKSSEDLTLAEASILAGIPKNPTAYNPITNYENSKKRQLTVLNSMVENEYITNEEKETAFNETLDFYGQEDNTVLNNLNYFKDAVFQELDTLKQIPKSLIETGGIKIYTTLDIEAQTALNDIITEEMASKEDLEVGALIVEPKTGKIIALMGGKDYNKSQFNRVTQAKRQAGSTFKPILYYSALENGLTSSSTFKSEATTFSLENGKSYSPKNYADKYGNRDISLAAAIAYSDNVYAVKTHLFLGENLLVETAKRMGIETELQANASLPLGTTEMTMLDYSSAYSTIANNGIKNDNYLIRKVTDMNDNILYEHKYEEEQVLNRQYTYILSELLSNTYNYSFVDYSSPTMMTISGLLTHKYAIKSGTTNSDCWAVGYTPELLTMVWNGYDDNRDTKSGTSSTTKRIWARTMESILKNKETSWYEIPEGVTVSLANPISGKYEENSTLVPLYYIKGTEPGYINNFIIQKENS